eukprot:CAMPEP_0202728492 /NCGR_PEP_ID=MMETSP1385-20130828/185652_1 /ASSEMBLY_ACC=CAM_ASM_000861 /TAXON_ID=933848 /ORGANISM="Elphidium margaritaceum" /LENGTH=568 /DNA_ID=CAMNT_0049394741 /DNA_START=19 /DNA_END=1725 /DNA_ORIENTATION=-
MVLKTGFDMQSELQTMQTTFTLNVSDILLKIDEFSKGDYVQAQRTFCGRELGVTFYPKGNHASTSSKSSIFVFLSKPDNPEINGAEPLKMVCELRCGVRRSRYFGNIAKFEPNGLGYQNFNTLDDLQKNPMITISATMHYKYSCMQLELQTMQMTFTLNASDILLKIDEFSNDEYVLTQRTFCGRKLSVFFYPKGDRGSHAFNSSIFLRLSKPDNPDMDGAEPLKMSCELRCGGDRWRYDEHSIADFERSSVGYADFHTLDYLQKNPVITISATMHYKYSCIVPTKDDFWKHCEEMADSTYRDGDIMLHVKTQTDSEDVDDEPPAKKRKLNNHATENKNKEEKNKKVMPRRSKRLQHQPSVVSVDTCSLSEEEGDESESSKESSSEEAAVATVRACSIVLKASSPVSHESSSEEAAVDKVRACSIVLKASSPVFKRMLESNMQESQAKEITVRADSVDAVHDMLYFMWTNEFPVHERNNMLSLIKLAHYYECERLKIACINQIIQELSVDNFVDVVNTLNQYSIEEGMSAILTFANKNRETIIADARCNELPFMFKMGVLKMCEYNCN